MGFSTKRIYVDGVSILVWINVFQSLGNVYTKYNRKEKNRKENEKQKNKKKKKRNTNCQEPETIMSL